MNDFISSPSILNAGQALTSRNGQFMTMVWPDGNFAVLDIGKNKIIWMHDQEAKRAKGAMPYRLELTYDGNLEFRNGSNGLIWESDTRGMGYKPFKFGIMDDGTIAIWDTRSVLMWSDKFYKTCENAQQAFQKDYGGKWADFVTSLHTRSQENRVWKGPRCTPCEEAGTKYKSRYPHIGDSNPGYHQRSTRNTENNIWNALNDCWNANTITDTKPIPNPAPSTAMVDGKAYAVCSNPAAASPADQWGRRWGWDAGSTCVIVSNAQAAPAAANVPAANGPAPATANVPAPAAANVPAANVPAPAALSASAASIAAAIARVAAANVPAANGPAPATANVPAPVAANVPAANVPAPAALSASAASIAAAIARVAAANVPAPKNNVDTVMDQTNIPSDNIFLDNGSIKVGFNMSRGSGIFYISESNSSTNMINSYDTGRFIQQSYCGNPDGSAWPGAGPNGSAKPWAWNPVQGGSYDNQVSKINKWGQTQDCFRSTVTPRNWASTALLPEVEMEQTVCLLRGTLVRCNFLMKYNGTVHHVSKDHELPAMFVDWSFPNLMAYKGNAPWTNKPLSNISPPTHQGPDLKNFYHEDLGERWIAWVNDKNYGIGIYFPHTPRITCYKYYVPGNHAASCCYVAPLMNSGLAPNQKKEYDVYLMIGNLDIIRSVFSTIKK